jgi:hypothetical protein
MSETHAKKIARLKEKYGDSFDQNKIGQTKQNVRNKMSNQKTNPQTAMFNKQLLELKALREMFYDTHGKKYGPI